MSNAGPGKKAECLGARGGETLGEVIEMGHGRVKGVTGGQTGHKLVT